MNNARFQLRPGAQVSLPPRWSHQPAGYRRLVSSQHLPTDGVEILHTVRPLGGYRLPRGDWTDVDRHQGRGKPNVHEIRALPAMREIVLVAVRIKVSRFGCRPPVGKTVTAEDSTATTFTNHSRLLKPDEHRGDRDKRHRTATDAQPRAKRIAASRVAGGNPIRPARASATDYSLGCDPGGEYR